MTPTILTFTPIKLIMADQTEWEKTQLTDNTTEEFQSESITIWWDKLNVSLVESNTDTFGSIMLSVNVTHSLLPEEGLIANNGHLNQTLIPKIAQNANVIINGIKAEKTSVAGVYTANCSIIFPEAYVFVTAVQNEWSETQEAYNFTHNPNNDIWIKCLSIGTILLSLLFTIAFKKSNYLKSLNKRQMLPLVGCVFLLLASSISFFWSLVIVQAVLNGFGWMLLALAELGCLVLGLISSISAIKKKNHALIIFTITPLFVVNSIAIKLSFDIYQFAIPWMIIFASIVICIIGLLCFTNADEEFS
jgi:hypothetical protein